MTPTFPVSLPPLPLSLVALFPPPVLPRVVTQTPRLHPDGRQPPVGQRRDVAHGGDLGAPRRPGVERQSGRAGGFGRGFVAVVALRLFEGDDAVVGFERAVARAVARPLFSFLLSLRSRHFGARFSL